MRMLTPLSLLVLCGVALGLPAAGVPNPPEEFAQPQSPAKPAPFPISYIDHGKFDPRLKGYQTPDGFKLEIVATDPVIVNPVGMTFTPEGTLLVLEWKPDTYSDGRWFEFKETFRYRDGTARQIATMKKFVLDPVKELKYNSTKGTFDSAKVIITDQLPSTVLYHDGWIYLTGRGSIRRYKQSRPDGLWDIQETIAQGFCGFHHHQVSGLSVGNDNKLYITSGDDDNFVEGSDGSRATVLRTGGIFRCNLDGSQMETYSLGYRNPYRDMAHDASFNWFHTDNDNEDGSRFTGCRIMHITEGLDYGWRLAIGARCCRPDNLRGAVAGELPGKVAPMIKTGRGSPAGLLIYNDTRLPEQYRGLLNYPDVYRKVVRTYKVAPVGATFAITHEFELLKSDDPLFRPCQMVTGPDGAIYICDWRTDSGGAGKLWGDGINGRIYRLSWAGTKEQPALPLRGMDSWAKLLKLNDADLAMKLAAEDFSDRLIARNELIRRGAGAVRAVFTKFVSGSLPPAGRLPALGVLQSQWSPDVEDLFRLSLRDESADVRRLAVEAIGQHAKPTDRRLVQAIEQSVADSALDVRRSALLALSRVGAAESIGVVLNAWKSDSSKDAFLSDAYLRAIENFGAKGIDALLQLANNGDPVLRDKVAVAFTGLRTLPAAEALNKFIAAEYLLPSQRADLIRSYANYQFEQPLSLEPLAAFMKNRPNEAPPAKIATLELLRGTGSLGSTTTQDLVMMCLRDTDETVRIAALATVEIGGLKAASQLITSTISDETKSIDERAAAIRSIKPIGNAASAEQLAKILESKATIGLKVEALRAVNAIDPKRATVLATSLLEQADVTLINEAVTLLGANKAGAKLLGERYLAKKLPKETWPRVSESLKKFITDPEILKLNLAVMKGGLLLSLAPADLAKVKELVATKGNPARGKQIYLNAALVNCVTCHKLEGIGGQVGPDLTRVWDTHTIEKIVESIAQPSKEIKEGYQAYRLNTAAGQTYIGLKISENTKEVVIREATGRDIRVAKDDVESLATSKVSLMPEDGVSQLSYDQYIDLLAFLKNQATQESLRGTVTEYEAIGGFPAGLEKSTSIESTITAKNDVQDSASVWKTQATDTSGVLWLQPFLGPKPSSTYARTYVYTPTARKATLIVQTNEQFRVWLTDGKKGNTLVAERATATTEEFRKTIDLPAGWSKVLTKVSTDKPSAALILQLQADGLRFAIKPE